MPCHQMPMPFTFGTFWNCLQLLKNEVDGWELGNKKVNKKQKKQTPIWKLACMIWEEEGYLHELTLLWNMEYEGRCYIWHLTSAARYSDISTIQHFPLYALW